jgi:hypothetical protein
MLQVLPCKSPDLGIEMGGRYARTGQVEWIEEYLDVKVMNLLKESFYSIITPRVMKQHKSSMTSSYINRHNKVIESINRPQKPEKCSE